MTEGPHARHRPRTERDPAQTSPPTSLGRLYPTEDVLAVVDDRRTGERVLRALKEAGVPEDEMDIVDPDWFLAVGHAYRQRRGLLERLAALVAMQEGQFVAEYEQEARQGHPLLVVHAGDDRERVERVRGVLRAYGARRIRYYQPNVIEDL
jgi:hypothetical protein